MLVRYYKWQSSLIVQLRETVAAPIGYMKSYSKAWNGKPDQMKI
jgi:hypothetical protein